MSSEITSDSFPCTSSESKKCCGGKGKCRPTRYGGKCELNDRSRGRKFFIYDEDGVEQDYGPEQERSDRENYEDLYNGKFSINAEFRAF